MGYDITKFDFKADLASAAFNAKFQEVETYLNNISSEIQTLRDENKTLKEKLDNKVDFLFGEKVIELVKDATNTKSFIGVGKVTDDSVGLGKGSWYHFIYLSHYGGDGYGSVVAIPFNVTTIFVRSSNGTHWTNWRDI